MPSPAVTLTNPVRQAVVERLEDRTFFSTGAGPDPAFADGGRLIVATEYARRANALRVQSDGKLIVVGADTGALSVARYDTGGNPDPSFGSAGRVTLDATPFDDVAYAVALAPDGSIVVAAGGMTPSAGGGAATVVLVRITPSGQSDPSFGAAGVARHDYFPATRPPTLEPSCLVLQPDGKILVAGSRRPDNSPSSWVFMHRYNADGSPDASFGAAGAADATFPGAGYEENPFIGLQPDGRIVLVTAVGDDRFGPNRTGIRRFDAAGQPDPSFPVREVRQVRPAEAIFRPDGSTVVAGRVWVEPSGGYDLALLSLNPDGSMNERFGRDGLRSANLGTDSQGSLVQDNWDTTHAAAFGPAGEILVVAGTGFAFREFGATLLMRYDPQGNLQRRFGGENGILGRDTPRRDADVIDLAVAPDGSLLLLSVVQTEDAFSVQVTRHAPGGGQGLAPRAKLAGKTLRVRGTSGDDTIMIATDPAVGEIVVTANGVASRFAAAGVRRIVLQGGRGDDVLSIDAATSLPATLAGGPGHDQLAGGGGIDRLLGGPGNDRAAGDDRDQRRGIEAALV